MQPDSQRRTVGERYAAALDAHYSAKDLLAAMELYEKILIVDPKSQEAVYSRTQIVNIVRSVVPEDDLLAVHTDLARSHLATGEIGTSDRAATEPQDSTSRAEPPTATE